MKKVALITGGSRGIGFGIALQLAETGFDIAINGVREQSQVEDAIGQLKSSGANVIYCRGNISSSEDRAGILEEINSHFGRLHVLVNNAGMAPRERRDILEATEESFDEVVSTNLKGPYFLTQKVARWMIEQQDNDAGFSGCIINVSSISATVVSVNRGEYCISKAGVSMATQLFAARLGQYNIPVFEVRPGVIYTDMTAGVKDKYDQLISNGLCVTNRWGQSEDVGKVVAALAGGGFMYSTGQVIMVDGGLTIPRL
ncbi:3-ketoacyl-ACP reductase [Pollutibacter soli]|uniref:3-ketoacyl-ACP reductase n=1 Tax=Pollutibacter soli TaxID=3034157 RepID=UPI0030138543